jgi:hypothetical protein
MRIHRFRSLAGATFSVCGVLFGCAASSGSGLADDQTQGGGSGGSAGDSSTGGSGDTSGTGGSVSGSGGQGGGASGTPSTGGATSGGTGSGTGGTSPTGGTSAGGTGGTRPTGRPTIPLPYTDDFETSMAADWRFISVPWTVMDDGGNNVLQLSSTGDSETTWAVGGDRNWADVKVEMRVKFVSGDGMILLSPKWKDLDSYAFVEYEAEDKPKLRRRLNGSTQDIITAPETMTFALGEWHTVAVTLKGTMATLEINGTVIGTGTDSTPVPTGGIGIAVENGIVAIDDVSVTEPP